MLMTKELSVSVAFFGTGHYLSPGGGGGFWGGSVVAENPKGRITENFGRIYRGGGPLKFAWKMKACGGGGSRKWLNVIGGSLQ